MNKTEIIEYLKQNKEKGVAFDFMPPEVREWCKEHHNESIFNIYYSSGWNIIRSEINCYYSGIYALPEDYEPKTKFEPHWEIFDIDEHGWFTTNADSDHSPTPYYWWQWQMFLSANDDKYNGFGGWFYDSVGIWNTSPQLLTSLGDIDGLSNGGVDITKDKPAIPTKIAFWRYRE